MSRSSYSVLGQSLSAQSVKLLMRSAEKVLLAEVVLIERTGLVVPGLEDRDDPKVGKKPAVLLCEPI